MVFIQPDEQSLRASIGDAPIERKRLAGFQRVSLPVGGSADLVFELTPKQFAMVDPSGTTSLHSGRFKVLFSRGHGDQLAADVLVQPVGGDPIQIRSLRKWW